MNSSLNKTAPESNDTLSSGLMLKHVTVGSTIFDNMKREIICGIYKITNPKGQIYIGKSKDIDKRWRGYKKLHYKEQIKLHKSFMDFGIENHVFDVVEICDIKNTNHKEKYWIAFYNSCNTSCGLNCNKGGAGPLEHTEETKKKIGAASKGNKYRTGHKHTEEGKELRRAYKHTEEAKLKISQNNAGQKRTSEQKEKMSKAQLGKQILQKTRDKIRKTLTGTKHSKETIRKRALANSGENNPMFGKKGKDHPAFGRKHNPETIEKMKLSNKLMWERKRREGTDKVSEETKLRVKTGIQKSKENPEYSSPEEVKNRFNLSKKVWKEKQLKQKYGK